MKRHLDWALLAAASVLVSNQVHSAPLYRYQVSSVTVTDLGTLGGTNSGATDINDLGSISGWAELASGLRHAFIIRSGVMTDIGAARPAAASEGRGINNSDAVVGHFAESPGTRAFLWLPGLFLPLRHESPYGDPVSSTAAAINDAYISVGQRAFIGWGYSESTVWPALANFESLHGDTFPWSSTVHDINASNAAVGREKDTESTWRWQWRTTGVTRTRVPAPGPYGTSGYSDTDAFGINDAGAVVGYAYYWDGAMQTRRAMYWNGSSTYSSDLGVFPGGRNSVAEDINNGTFIAGYADTFISFPPYFTLKLDDAFLFHRDFGKYVLPRLASTPWIGHCRAVALNERSSTGRIQVVGTCDANGGTRAVRWDVNVRLVSTQPPPF